jgi:hypothetical protein
METRAQRFLDAGFDPGSSVLLGEPPPEPTGTATLSTAEPGAEIAAESPTEIVVRARFPSGGGYLVLYDSHDPNWRVEVDGVEAPILQANTLFRAVRAAEGDHTIRFVYRPVALYIGLGVSTSTLVLLMVLGLRWRVASGQWPVPGGPF